MHICLRWMNVTVCFCFMVSTQSKVSRKVIVLWHMRAVPHSLLLPVVKKCNTRRILASNLKDKWILSAWDQDSLKHIARTLPLTSIWKVLLLCNINKSLTRSILRHWSKWVAGNMGSLCSYSVFMVSQQVGFSRKSFELLYGTGEKGRSTVVPEQMNLKPSEFIPITISGRNVKDNNKGKRISDTLDDYTNGFTW